MSELGQKLRRARQQAGLSLAGMAKRTGYSRGYLGNVETGERQATPGLIRAYERALDDSVNRRQLMIGSLATLAASSVDDAAVSIVHEIREERSGMLTQIQTTHETDKAIASLVGSDTASLASLTKWTRRGSTILRVNAAGILAKVGMPLADTEVVKVLRADGEVRELYLTAVLSRVLSLPWTAASSLAACRNALSETQISRLIDELRNWHDSGARWCAAIILDRNRDDHPERITAALVAALKTEPSAENLRALGSALAGVDPLAV